MDPPISISKVFPDEVIIQILVRLPIKSVFKFKQVCKLWCKLLSERYFIQLYNRISVTNPRVLIEVSDSSESKSGLICIDKFVGVSDLNLDFIKDRVKIRASCNGLLCCSSIPDKGVYYVCNPMTRQYKLLPRCRERPVTRFYPDGEATLVGLACDLFNFNKFSVVLAGYHRSFGHRPDRNFMCLVYDSDTNKWRKFNSLQDDYFTHMNINQVVYVNGALHWMTGSYSCVLVLNLKNDVLGKISLPNEVHYGSGTRAYLLDFDGLLSIIQISDSWLTIWALKDYDIEKWEVVDKVSLRCIRGMVPGIFPISQGGDYMFLATHKQILVYNRKAKAWKEMYAVRNGCTLPLWFSAHSFRNTLLAFD